MKNIVCTSVAAASLACVVFGEGGSQAKPTVLRVSVNDKVVKFNDQQPAVIKGRTLVPLRGVFEAIGAYVEYDKENDRITARMGNEDVELKIGSKVATKDGSEILMDVPPMIYKGTTMVPLRFLAQSLGAKVDYDKVNRLIKVTMDQGAMPSGDSDGGDSGDSTRSMSR